MSRMPFGKFKGERLQELPNSYVEWLLGLDLREPLRTKIKLEYQRRTLSENVAHVVPIDLVSVAEAVITAGVRALAKTHHPDVGGSHQAMVALNRCADWLRQQSQRIAA
ncbi:MAG: DUF3820 family protein [Deltaproteobacteria bacterium]|nr:DUF3820 family protein [Deltaproteobacteria bacterium]